MDTPEFELQYIEHDLHEIVITLNSILHVLQEMNPPSLMKDMTSEEMYGNPA